MRQIPFNHAALFKSYVKINFNIRSEVFHMVFTVCTVTVQYSVSWYGVQSSFTHAPLLNHVLRANGEACNSVCLRDIIFPHTPCTLGIQLNRGIWEFTNTVGNHTQHNVKQREKSKAFLASSAQGVYMLKDSRRISMTFHPVSSKSFQISVLYTGI